jgi:hypothetical protein
MIATMAKRASKEPANNKLAQLKARHFTPEGRKERIAKALQILDKPVPGFTLDRETWMWVAEDLAVEDL